MDGLILVLLALLQAELIGDFTETSSEVTNAKVVLFTTQGDTLLTDASLYKKEEDKKTYVYFSSPVEVAGYSFLLFNGERFVASTGVQGYDQEVTGDVEMLEEAYEVSEQELKLAIDDFSDRHPLDELIDIVNEEELIGRQALGLEIPESWYSLMIVADRPDIDFSPIEEVIITLTRVYSEKYREFTKFQRMSQSSLQTKLAIIKKYAKYNTEELKTELEQLKGTESE